MKKYLLNCSNNSLLKEFIESINLEIDVDGYFTDLSELYKLKDFTLKHYNVEFSLFEYVGDVLLWKEKYINGNCSIVVL